MSRMSCLGCGYEGGNDDFRNNLSTTAGFEDPEAQRIRRMIGALPPEIQLLIRRETHNYGYSHPHVMEVIGKYERMCKR